MRTATIFRLTLVLSLALAVAACSTPKQPPLPVGNLKIGVSYFTQPKETGDLFAGYMTEDTPVVDQNILGELDLQFAQVLAEHSQNEFTPAQRAFVCAKQLGDQFKAPQAALRRWSALGRCMNVDLLIVPQLLEWRERDGGEYGVTTPAKVVMDIYVLDVNAESLISRSRYDETQSALTSNLLDTGKFLKRGGKWVQARDLAQEGMEKAVKELGL